MNFPFLKKPLFYLFLFSVLFLSFSTGFLFSKAPENALSPKEEKAALSDAIKGVEEKLALATKEEKLSLLESLSFYQTAEEFNLSIHSNPFHSQWASLYAKMLCLEAQGYDKAEEKNTLIRILEEKNAKDLLSFYETYLESIKIEKEKRASLLSAAKTSLFSQGANTPGKRALLYDIDLLKKSLSEEKDYFSGSETPLDEKEKTYIQNLLSLNLSRLEKGEYDPVYTNSIYLSAGENLAALGTCLLSLYCTSFISLQEKRRKAKALALLGTIGFLALLTLILSLVFSLTTTLFAKGTVLPLFFVTKKGFFSLPFFIGLYLRLFVKVLTYLPLIALSLFAKKETKSSVDPKILALISCVYYLIAGAIPFLSAKLFLVFSLLIPSGCLFPPITSFTPKSANPLFSLILWAVIFAFVLFFPKIKKSIKK